MILVHKLSHTREPFHVNPDLITTIEANPDTVISLTTGTKIVVAEDVDEVVAATRAWRTGILRDASSVVHSL